MANLKTLWLPIGNDRVFVRQWMTDSEPRGVIHICHGMMEHSGMYHEWACQLCQLGWDVVSHDHPGSGYSVSNGDAHDHLSTNGETRIEAMVMHVDQWIRTHYSMKPVVRYGHSMGSFIVLAVDRKYKSADALILTGMTYDSALSIRIQGHLIAWFSRVFGMNCQATLAKKLIFDPLNHPFKPNTSPVDWISRSSNVVKQYMTDPLCGNTVSWGYLKALNALYFQAFHGGAYRYPKTLVLTGEKDSLSNGGKKIRPWIRTISNTSYIQHKVVPGAHHKVECDQASAMVIQHIKQLLDQVKE